MHGTGNFTNLPQFESANIEPRRGPSCRPRFQVRAGPWGAFPQFWSRFAIPPEWWRMFWSAANEGLRDGGLSKSEDIWGKRPFSSVFWIFQVLSGPSGKGRKRQKKGEKGWSRPISRTGGQTPLKPAFVTPPFAALQMLCGVLLPRPFIATNP